ncbi:MAG: lipopolysaccharide biosynthesis protein [Solirubrobacterales bacterium]
MRASGQGDAGSEARSYGRRASLLSIGVGLTGLITYLYFAIASHELSKDDYGEIAVLWSAVFITVSTLQRPVEQLLSRSVSEHIAVGRSYSHPVRVAAGIQAGISLAFVLLSIALREPITDGLLHGNSTLFWIGVAAIAAYGASYFARGFLAGSHRLSAYALLIISESVSRTAFPFAVALGIASGQDAVALGIVAAPTLSLIVVPFAFLRRGSARGAAGAGAIAESEGEGAAPTDFTLAEGSAFAAAVFLIMLSEQTFLNAGPLLVSASAGAAAAGFIFNILMIARAPLQLFQAVSTSLLPHLTRLGSQGSEEDFRASVRVTIAAIAAFAGAVGVAMLIAGPELMQIAFGDNFTYERVDLLLVTAGMGLYLSAATLNQAALARRQVRAAAACWIGCAIAFVIWTAVPIVSDEFRRVEAGYLGAAAVLCTLLYALYRRPLGEAGTIAPGSTDEMELQLAAADEGSP